MNRPVQFGRRALSTRFLVYFAITYTVLIGLMGWVIMRSVESALVEDLTTHLVVDAELTARSIPDDPAEYGSWAEEIFELGGIRVTLIDLDGVVVADSHSDPAVMENHAERPEVVMAVEEGVVGHASRVSASTGFEQHYVALPPEDGVIVRVSIPQRAIAEQFDPIRTSVIVTSVVVGLIGVAIVALLSRRLSRPVRKLTSQVEAIAAGDRSVAPRRSSVTEYDQLGLAVASLVAELDTRAIEAEAASETLEVVLGALPQGTVLVAADDTITYANPSAYDLLGVVPDDLGGLAPYPLQVAVRESRETRNPVTRVVDGVRPSRRLRGVALPFADDERILLIVADVTERDRADAIRRDFVANASHELKTPLSSIVASSDALRIAVRRADGSAERFVDQIESSAHQLGRMVGDLLDLSRLERENPEMDPLRLDLVVREEAERIRREAERDDVELHVEASPVKVAGSSRDLSIAVRNVLDNAVKYTADGGRIDVRVEADGPDAVVSIADTGLGIPTRDLDRVFERFYRVDAARSRASGGTGLGLAIVKHVVQGHNGDVEVESELGVGSTFRLRLPLLEEESTPASN